MTSLKHLVQQAFAFARDARPANYERAILKIEKLLGQALSAIENPRENAKVNRVEVIDHTPGSEGRVFTKMGVNRVEVSLQDDGKTLKVFLS